MRYASKWPQYAAWWDRMTINKDRLPGFTNQAKVAVTHKDQYLAIEQKTGVHWYHIAVLHRRESDANFNTYLGNGQSLAHRTTIVPKGRGPFTGPGAFIDGAVDALKLDGLTSVQDWRLEKILYYCELFNGAGYDERGLPSPYIFGGTNIQQPGKFIRDGVFDRHVMDPQPGCAPLLLAISQLDPTVIFTRETAQ